MKAFEAANSSAETGTSNPAVAEKAMVPAVATTWADFLIVLLASSATSCAALITLVSPLSSPGLLGLNSFKKSVKILPISFSNLCKQSANRANSLAGKLKIYWIIARIFVI